MQNLLVYRPAPLPLVLTFRRLLHKPRNETYYDVLQISNDSSTKEIRSAFVHLTKKFHPDVMGAASDPTQTAQFVKISEAYQILSKPKTRCAYDQYLWDSGFYKASHVVSPHVKPVRSNNINNINMEKRPTEDIFKPWEIKPNIDPNPGPYYGVKGLNRVSNVKVALALLGLGIFGAVFGFASVKNSFTFSRELLDDKSMEAGLYHAAIRADAEKYGNDEQIRRMANRIKKAQEER